MKELIEQMVLAIVRQDVKEAETIFSQITENTSMSIISEMTGWGGGRREIGDRRLQQDNEAMKSKLLSTLSQVDPLVDSEDADITVRTQEEGGPYGAIEVDIRTGRFEDSGLNDFEAEVTESWVTTSDGRRANDPTFQKLAEQLVNDLSHLGYKQGVDSIRATLQQMRAYIQQNYQ